MSRRLPGELHPMDVLEALVNFAIDYQECFVRRDAFLDLLRGRYNPELSVNYLTRTLHNLKRSGYIKMVHRDAQCSIEYTNKARLKLIERTVGKLNIDKRYRFVSFDIPEEKSRQRNGFRRVIKRLGFKQIQKSLWVCNKDVSGLVEIATQEHQVENYVVYIVAEKTDIDSTIDEMFKPKKFSVS